MKASLFSAFSLTALTLASVSALACPDLSGTFECKGRLVGISQETANGVTEFQTVLSPFFGRQLTVSQFKDDGVTVNVPEALDLSSIPARYSCQGDAALRLESNFNDSTAGQTTMTKLFTINSDGDLNVATQLAFAQGGSRSLNEVCRRK